MSSAWHPGQLLWVGFEGLTPPADLLDLISAGRIGGVVLFARNIESPDQVRDMTRTLLAQAPPKAPLLLGIDQEGGAVQRLRSPWTEWPAMRTLGDRNDLELTHQAARALSEELLDCGIRLNFAPVVDVDTNPENPIIGSRSFGSDPDRVGHHAQAFIKALQESGVAACAKHFPGHGDTGTDSHLELPQLNHDLERLRKVEFKPFLAAIEADVAAIMTAHILFPQIDPIRPATMSAETLKFLREDFGYDGVIFSDDLEMKAMADHFSIEEQVHGCLEAGVDGLLICKDRTLRNTALQILESLPEALLAAPRRRLAVLKARYAEPGKMAAKSLPTGPPYPDHQALALRLGPPPD